MNRRDFIKAFSAGTTLATATSLASIVDAKPVINKLENKIILPGDKAFHTDWVFNYVAYFRHEYELSNELVIGVDVPDYFDDILNRIEGNSFKFTFELEDCYFFRYGRPGLSAVSLSSYIEEFLSSNVFEVSKDDFQIGEEVDTDVRSAMITHATTIAEEI